MKRWPWFSRWALEAIQVPLLESGSQRLDAATRGEGCVTTEAETGTMDVQTQELQQPPETARGRWQILPYSLQRGYRLTDLEFMFLSSRKEKTFSCCKHFMVIGDNSSRKPPQYPKCISNFNVHQTKLRMVSPQPPLVAVLGPPMSIYQPLNSITSARKPVVFDPWTPIIHTHTPWERGVEAQRL